MTEAAPPRRIRPPDLAASRIARRTTIPNPPGTGPSCGGLGCYTLAARLARRGDLARSCPPFAAVAPVCGGGGVVFAPLLRETPCWFWHSASDSAVSCEDTEKLVAALRALGAPVKFTKLSDAETPPSPAYVAFMTHHNAWTPAYKPDSPLWPWMFAQARAAARGAARPVSTECPTLPPQ